MIVGEFMIARGVCATCDRVAKIVYAVGVDLEAIRSPCCAAPCAVGQCSAVGGERPGFTAEPLPM